MLELKFLYFLGLASIYFGFVFSSTKGQQEELPISRREGKIWTVILQIGQDKWLGCLSEVFAKRWQQLKLGWLHICVWCGSYNLKLSEQNGDTEIWKKSSETKHVRSHIWLQITECTNAGCGACDWVADLRKKMCGLFWIWSWAQANICNTKGKCHSEL